MQRTPVCPDNAEVAAFLWDKWQEMAQKPKGTSENLNNTMYKAYSGLCSFKTPVKSLKDLAEIKGVGKWTLKLMQEFFSSGSGNSEGEEVTKKGKGEKGARRYLPQKNSVAYALLITLYRGTMNDNDFMRKQELIDAAEGTGLSRVSIAPEKGKGKPGQFGSSPRDWYSGWSCMKTLVAKGLVVKSSCPAKYMLTEEGKKTARDCLSRSGLDSSDNAAIVPAIPGPDLQRTLKTESTDEDIVVISSAGDSTKGVARLAFTTANQKKSFDVPPGSLDKFLAMGYSKEQIIHAFHEEKKTSGKKDASSLWPAVLCCLKEYQLYDLHNEPGGRPSHNDRREPTGSARKRGSRGFQLDDDRSINKARSSAFYSVKPSGHPHFSPSFRAMRSCSSTRTPVCPENAEVAAFLWDKWQEMAQKPLGISENLNNTMYKAYSGLCSFKTPVKSLKDLAEIKGVGKWTLKLMKEFFINGSGNSEGEEVTKKGKGEKGARRYLPQKNSVAYALLITLYRGTMNDNDFMRKQELIDAAEGSGLSRVSIAPEKGKGKPGQFGSSARDWYSGWSCMKTLVAKGLVVKSSCPAKYMLTEEGKKAARDCLSRSGLDSSDNAAIVPAIPGPDPQRTLKTESTDEDIVAIGSAGDSAKGVARSAFTTVNQSRSIDVPPESLDKFLAMGYSKEQIIRSFREASEASGKKDASSLWPAVLCCLKEYQLYDLHNEPGGRPSHNDRREPTGSARKRGSRGSQLDDDRPINKARSSAFESVEPSGHPHFSPSFRAMRSCSSTDLGETTVSKSNAVAKPPLNFGERFEDVYEVVLVLDDREHFASKGSRSKKIIENVCIQFKVQIEVRRLPVGDAIWLARHKSIGTEYVLDFIVERKGIHDLQSSIRDNRYKDQKLQLLRLGLKKMIYLVEGDPNSSEAAEAIKSACFTTEILEGFDVQRTSGLADTLKKYGYLTHAIHQYYKSLDCDEKSPKVCPPYQEFIRKCDDLEKMTVGDVFAIQLMQVPQVTEEIAISVSNMYPTLASLARAYNELEGNICEQEEMLRKQSNNLINGVASRNIFQLIWGA